MSILFLLKTTMKGVVNTRQTFCHYSNVRTKYRTFRTESYIYDLIIIEKNKKRSWDVLILQNGLYKKIYMNALVVVFYIEYIDYYSCLSKICKIFCTQKNKHFLKVNHKKSQILIQHSRGQANLSGKQC